MTNAKFMERRIASRHPVEMSVEFTAMPDNSFEKDMSVGLIINISQNGVLLSCGSPVKVGSELLLMINTKLDGNKIPVGIIGEVVRQQQAFSQPSHPNAEHLYGIRFKNFPRNLAS